MNPYKILFVDDDEFIRKIYADRFEATGFKTSVASSLDTAEKLLEDDTFDLICLDYMLGTESGLDLLRWIRIKKGIQTPVIIFSASGHEHKIEEFMAAGATEYIQKDHVVPSQLVEKIKKIIEDQKANQKHE